MRTSQHERHGIDDAQGSSVGEHGNQASSLLNRVNEPEQLYEATGRDHMEVDQAHTHVDPTFDSNGSKGGAGQKLWANNEYIRSDSSFLDSLLPPPTYDYGSTLDTSNPNQLLRHHLFSGPNQLADYDYYGFQAEVQQPHGYEQPLTPGDTALSSSYDTIRSVTDSATNSNGGASLSVDFSEFNDHMRQYQQAAMASQHRDTNDSPSAYFQQPASRQSTTPSLNQSHTYPLHQRHRLSLPHQWRSSPTAIGEVERTWSSRTEQGSQKVDVGSGDGGSPADSNFARYQVDFPKTLWEASDVSREPGIIAEQRQVGLLMPPLDIPAQDQHFLYHSSSLSPSTQYSQGPPAMPLSLHTLTATASQRATSQRSLSTGQQAHNGQPNADLYQASDVPASASSQEMGALSSQFATPSAQPLRHSRPLSYRLQSFSSLSHQIEASANDATGYASSGWSNSSRRHERTVPPIHIPGSSYDGNAFDHERVLLSSAGSSIGSHSSERFAASPMTGTPPQSPTLMESTASLVHQSASQSGIVTGKRLYECKICSRKFPRPSALVVHERIHSGDKPFICEVCDRPFTVASNLRRHQKIHAKQLKQANMSAQAAESIGPSTVRAKPQRSKPYPSSSSGQQQDKDSQESELSAEIEDGNEYGSSEGSVSSLSALQPVAGPSRTLPNLANIMDWTQKVGSHSPPDPLPGD